MQFNMWSPEVSSFARRCDQCSTRVPALSVVDTRVTIDGSAKEKTERLCLPLVPCTSSYGGQYLRPDTRYGRQSAPSPGS